MPDTLEAAPHSVTSQSPFALLFPDFETELKTTRRILERVPDERNDYSPHEKSMNLGQLATHVAQLPGFGIMLLTRDEVDPSKRPPETQSPTTADRLAMFDEVSGQLRARLKQLDWEQAMAPVTIKVRDRTILEAPRAVMFRSATITHIAHHRAQLGVYLRILGVPIPGSYGPSADEPINPA